MKIWIENKDEITGILNRALVGRLGLIAAGEPYVVPLNFVWANERLYFHCGLEGRKLEALKTDAPVCFEVDELLEIAPSGKACLFTTHYRSVIITGTARLLEDDREKMRALNLLLEKYAAGASYEPLPEHVLAIVNVCEITPTRVTAKANLPDTEPG